jgi:hypothetical protein
MKLHICVGCQAHLPKTSFRKHWAAKNGLSTWCKICSKERSEKYREGRTRAKLRKYGLTPEDYQDLVKQQENCCAICRTNNYPLVIDHNHETNQVRGLLCSYCNTGLGFFRDRPELLNLASNYLFERKPLDNTNKSMVY